MKKEKGAWGYSSQRERISLSPLSSPCLQLRDGTHLAKARAPAPALHHQCYRIGFHYGEFEVKNPVKPCSRLQEGNNRTSLTLSLADICGTSRLPWQLSSKESACNPVATGDVGSIPMSGRSPGGGPGNPLRYSCLENPMDRRAWWASSKGHKELDTTEVAQHVIPLMWAVAAKKGHVQMSSWLPVGLISQTIPPPQLCIPHTHKYTHIRTPIRMNSPASELHTESNKRGGTWQEGIEAFQVPLVAKNLPADVGDLRDVGSILGSGRSHGGRNGNPLQYSCLENPMDRGAWWATAHRATKSQTQLN